MFSHEYENSIGDSRRRSEVQTALHKRKKDWPHMPGVMKATKLLTTVESLFSCIDNKLRLVLMLRDAD